MTAADARFVHLTWNEVIAWNKSFSWVAGIWETSFSPWYGTTIQLIFAWWNQWLRISDSSWNVMWGMYGSWNMWVGTTAPNARISAASVDDRWTIEAINAWWWYSSFGAIYAKVDAASGSRYMLNCANNANMVFGVRDDANVFLYWWFYVNDQQWTWWYNAFTITIIGTWGGAASWVSGTWRYKIIWKICHFEFTVGFQKNTLAGRVRIQLPAASRNGWEIACNAIMGWIGTKWSNQVGMAVLQWDTIEWLAWIGQAGDWSSYPSQCYAHGTVVYEIS